MCIFIRIFSFILERYTITRVVFQNCQELFFSKRSKSCKLLSQKSSIVDIRMSFKYASVLNDKHKALKQSHKCRKNTTQCLYIFTIVNIVIK